MIAFRYRFDAIVVGAGGAGLRAAFGLGEHNVFQAIDVVDLAAYTSSI